MCEHGGGGVRFEAELGSRATAPRARSTSVGRGGARDGVRAEAGPEGRRTPGLGGLGLEGAGAGRSQRKRQDQRALIGWAAQAAGRSQGKGARPLTSLSVHLQRVRRARAPSRSLRCPRDPAQISSCTAAARAPSGSWPPPSEAPDSVPAPIPVHTCRCPASGRLGQPRPLAPISYPPSPVKVLLGVNRGSAAMRDWGYV
jgi:hypothetical protein